MSFTREIIASASRAGNLTVTWGEVTSTSPLQVRIAGDTASTTIPLKMDSYTAVTNDKVVLLRVGVQWICLGDYS